MNKRSTKFYRKNEAEVMKSLGFFPTPNSGAGWVVKGDGQSEHCLCELKSTDKCSYSLKQDTLHIMEQQAAVSHKTPVFALQFLNTGEVWLMVKPEDIQNLQDIVKGIKPKESREMFDFSVDKTEELIYNKRVMTGNANKTALAREKYKTELEERYQKKGKRKH